MDEKMERWETNNPEKFATVIKSNQKRRKTEAYKPFNEDYILTNLKDGEYFMCDWCDESSHDDSDDDPKLFKTVEELVEHFFDKHDFGETYDQIYVCKSGAIDPILSEAMSVAEEILKKKGLNISVGGNDAVNIALSNEIDVDL